MGAQQQAAADRSVQVLHDDNAKLKITIKEKEERMAKMRHNEAALKAQVRDLQGKSQRSEVDMEYVKNVIIKYMEVRSIDGQEQLAQLLPLIGSLLEFTPDDIRKAREAHGMA